MPERILSMISRTCAVLRLWVPTWMQTPFRAAASIINRPSRTLCEQGFST